MCPMPRSMWSGAISFGLVNVPIKLYSAVNRKTVRFNQLNGKTGHRIAQKRVDPQTGEEVAYEDIVKGYELTKDRYVLITQDEHDRHRGLRRPRRHRPGLLRPSVLPRAGQGGGEGLRAAARRHARGRQGGDRAGRAALKGAAR